MHACVYIFPVVTLQCSVILGCRLSEDNQLSMTFSFNAVYDVKGFSLLQTVVKLAEEMFTLKLKAFLVSKC